MLKFDPRTADSVVAARTSPVIAVTETADAATIEDARTAIFLDAIIARLMPLPAEFHGEVRRELRLHLDALIAAHEELGATRDEAVSDAMRQFGDSGQIARRYRQAWRRTEAYERPWSAMRLALGAFSGAMLATCAAIGLVTPIIQGLIRLGLHVGTEFVFLIALVVVPLCVGAWVGKRSPRRASFGTFCALSALMVVGIAVWFRFGLETTGDQNTLIWVFHQLCGMVGVFFVFWLPTGWLGASIAAAAQTRKSRRQRGLG